MKTDICAEIFVMNELFENIITQSKCHMIPYDKVLCCRLEFVRRVDSSPLPLLSFHLEAKLSSELGTLGFESYLLVFFPEVKLRLLKHHPVDYFRVKRPSGNKKDLHSKEPLTFLHLRRRASIKP